MMDYVKAAKLMVFVALIACSICNLPVHCSVTAGIEMFNGIGRVIFAPGLRTLTIYDHDTPKNQTIARREKFLQKLKAGLEAQRPVRDAFQSKLTSLEQDMIQQQTSEVVSADTKRNKKKGSDTQEVLMDEELWEKKLKEARHAILEEEEREVLAAFDRGFSSVKDEDYAQVATTKPSIKLDNKYQYVGVINSPKLKNKVHAARDQPKSPSSGEKSSNNIFNNVQWYARKKPKQSNWTLRLVHVDRAAILHHYFQRGKIDIYGEYRNTGEIDSQTGKIAVTPVYTARPRNLLTLWNVNPIKELFLDRSGHKYRERRVPGGIYTDGAKVYEASYDFHYGRNGMKIISNSLASFLNETTVLGAEQAEKLKQRLMLKRKSPDIVVEF
mmetsp:Transcript_6213/g.9076  ORF Transcript_6213/g.9076 Transcript_6213/m.9076 type:complete len:384 (-) Transcript_6213:47-1198(-)